MDMKSQGAREGVCIIAIAGAVSFCILTIIAMLIYPGGTHADTSTTGYTFHMNFFSDLGATITPSGLINTGSAILFFIALTGIGVSFIPYLMAINSFLDSNNKTVVKCNKLGSVIGIIAAVSFIGIAFTPYDLVLAGHILFVQIAFIGLIPVGICFSISIFVGRVLPMKYGVVLLAFTVVAIAYVMLLFFGPSLVDEGGETFSIGLAINAIGQKVIVYDAIISLSIMVFGTYHKMHEKRP